jgi:hypothetical protein
VDLHGAILQAHHQAQQQGEPMLETLSGYTGLPKYRTSCGCEVATVCVFPNGQGFASQSTAEARDLSPRQILKLTTALELPLGDGRVNIIREKLAKVVATGVISRFCAVAYTSVPPLHQPDQFGVTGFHLAAKAGVLKLMEPWMRPYDYQSADRKGYTPALLAARHGPVQPWVRHLRQHHLRIQDATGSTLVHFAAERGELSALRPLLAPAHLMIQDCDGHTAAHLAAFAGTLTTLEGLLTPAVRSLRTKSGYCLADCDYEP